MGDSGRHKRIDRLVALEMEYLSLHRDAVGEHGGGTLTRDSEGKTNFQGMECRKFCRRVSLSIGVPLGNLERGSIYREL